MTTRVSALDTEYEKSIISQYLPTDVQASVFAYMSLTSSIVQRITATAAAPAGTASSAVSVSTSVVSETKSGSVSTGSSSGVVTSVATVSSASVSTPTAVVASSTGGIGSVRALGVGAVVGAVGVGAMMI